MCEETRVDDPNRQKKSKVYVDSIPRNVPELKVVSAQQWISVKDGKPDGRTGYYCGRYWCITERPVVKSDSMFSENGNYRKNVELCYWNDLADRFQDLKNEWVKVTYWSPVPELPQHQTTHITRLLMLNFISCGECEKVYYCDEADEYYLKNHVLGHGLYNVSYDETLYLSVEVKNHKYNYMYAVLTEKGRAAREAVLKGQNIKREDSEACEE